MGEEAGRYRGRLGGEAGFEGCEPCGFALACVEEDSLGTAADEVGVCACARVLAFDYQEDRHNRPHLAA